VVDIENLPPKPFTYAQGRICDANGRAIADVWSKRVPETENLALLVIAESKGIGVEGKQVLPPGPLTDPYVPNPGKCFAYIATRHEKKIFGLWGKDAEKIAMAQFIIEVFKKYGPT